MEDLAAVEFDTTTLPQWSHKKNAIACVQKPYRLELLPARNVPATAD
jgi:hypothetical protein